MGWSSSLAAGECMIERITRPRNPAKAGETQAKRSSAVAGSLGQSEGYGAGYRHPKTVILQALHDEDGPEETYLLDCGRNHL